VKHYRLREVPLRTHEVEPRGTLLDGWHFWESCVGGDAIFFDASPNAARVFVVARGVRELSLVRRGFTPPPQPPVARSRSAALPHDFLAADDAAAARVLGIPEKMIAVLYARYNGDDIVPRPEQ
jgi:hypothetical protein